MTNRGNTISNDNMNKDEYSLEINKYITEYIKFADAKAATLLTFLGLSLGGAFSLLKFLLKKIGELQTNNLDIVFITVSSVIIFIMVGYTFHIINYIFSTISPDITPEGGSLNSFPDIEKKQKANYLTDIENLKKFEIFKQYSIHNWQLSKISNKKFTNLKVAITGFKSFIIWFLILFIITAILSIVIKLGA